MLQLYKNVSKKDNFYRGVTKLCAVETNRKLYIHVDFNATSCVSERHSFFDGMKLYGWKLNPQIAMDNFY